MSKIVSITPMEKEQYVYDPVCEYPHAYAANGIISHNCVVLIDEIDKAFDVRSAGDSGVGKRVLGQLLTWMQECKKDAYVVLTANDVVGLPAELMRRGRLDQIWNVDIPNAAEREEILRIHLKQRKQDHTIVLTESIEASDGFMAAEIEGAVSEAVLQAYVSTNGTDLKAVTDRQIAKEFNEIKPLTVAFKEKIDRMREWALNNAKPANKQASGIAGGGKTETTTTAVKRKITVVSKKKN